MKNFPIFEGFIIPVIVIVLAAVASQGCSPWGNQNSNRSETINEANAASSGGSSLELTRRNAALLTQNDQLREAGVTVIQALQQGGRLNPQQTRLLEVLLGQMSPTAQSVVNLPQAPPRPATPAPTIAPVATVVNTALAQVNNPTAAVFGGAGGNMLQPQTSIQGFGGQAVVMPVPTIGVEGDMIFIGQPTPWDQTGGQSGGMEWRFEFMSLPYAVEMFVDGRRVCPFMGNEFAQGLQRNPNGSVSENCTIPPMSGNHTGRVMLRAGGSHRVVFYVRPYTTYRPVQGGRLGQYLTDITVPARNGYTGVSMNEISLY